MNSYTHFASPHFLWLLLLLLPMVGYYIYRTWQGGASITISSVGALKGAPRTIRYYLRHLPALLTPAKAKAKTTSTSTSASASASATATSPATSTATAPASVTAESTSTSTATSPAAVTTTSSSTTSSTSAESTKIAKEKTPFSWSEQLDYLYVRTNLLYFMGGLFNVGVEYKRPESDFGFLLNGGYSPFSNDSWDKNLGGWFVSPEVRYYIPKNDSWFVGAQLLYGGYNIKLAEGKPGRQGNVLCLGAMGGYKLAISQRLAMDFTLGLGYAKLDYDSYNVVQGRNISLDKNITKNSFLPIQGGINLIYKIK